MRNIIMNRTMRTRSTGRGIMRGAALAVLLGLASCSDFVQSVEPPINSVDDALLNSEDQLPFLIAGVRARFSTVATDLTVNAEALSDALVFDVNVPGATFTQYSELDLGNILFQNSAVQNSAMYLGELRLFADTLVTRASRISFTDTTLMNEAFFTGNFYGGIARYYWAAYYGLEKNEGGGVIAGGPFIPSNQMYDLAIERFREALKHVEAGSYQERLIQTWIAKCYLNQEKYPEAQEAALKGLVSGDAPFEASYSEEVENNWWISAGAGRTQLVIDTAIYLPYLADDPNEAARIPLAEIETYDGGIAYRQDKYPLAISPFPVATWQENELILAEVEIRSGAGGALERINAVRASHDIGEIPDVVDLDDIYDERAKELFATGNRLIDQRRFDRWHLDDDAWRYLPIPEEERNANPNL